MAADKYELKELIEELEDIRGRNTELVSLYIPPGYDIGKISGFLTSEQSEAENIKSKQTRKNVKSALDKLQRKLKGSKKTPENGVALFAGNVSEQEGRPEFEAWEIEPPEPIPSRIYRCDKEFVLEPLREMLIDKNVFGIVCIDKSEAAIGYVRGNTLTVESTLESNVPGKTTKGGQSQQRFERIRENMYDTFLTDVAEKCKQAFLQKAQDNELLGLIIGGPGFSKEDLVEKDYLPEALVDKIISQQGTNYSGVEGLEELLNKSEDVIEESEVIREKQAVNEFLENLKKDNGLSMYGKEDVSQALQMGAVDKLLISEDYDTREVKLECPNCGEEDLRYMDEWSTENDDHACEECGSHMDIVENKSVLGMMKAKAKQMDTEMLRISTNHEEGERLRNMGGLAALLRYRIR